MVLLERWYMDVCAMGVVLEVDETERGGEKKYGLGLGKDHKEQKPPMPIPSDNSTLSYTSHWNFASYPSSPYPQTSSPRQSYHPPQP